LRLVGKLPGENLPPVSRPILLAAEVDAPADERIGIEVHRLPIHHASDKFVRWQALHRGKTLRRVGDFHLKSGGGEQVLLLRDLPHERSAWSPATLPKCRRDQRNRSKPAAATKGGVDRFTARDRSRSGRENGRKN